MYVFVCMYFFSATKFSLLNKTVNMKYIILLGYAEIIFICLKLPI